MVRSAGDQSSSSHRPRGQVGIGTLIVFIAMVLVAAIAAGVLINTAGYLQSDAQATGQGASDSVTNRVEVTSVYGENIEDKDRDGIDEIDSINITIQQSPGSGPIDLRDMTIQYVGIDQWIDPNDDTQRVVTLIHADHPDARRSELPEGTTAQFNVTAIHDSDKSITNDDVLNDDDRVILMLDIGDEYDGHLHNDIDSVDSGQVMPLEGGDEAEITIDTATGGTTEVPINPPETLEGKNVVEL